jgi:hypothetical protein
LPAVIELAGGVSAPAQARRWVLFCLGGEQIGPPDDRVALIVSELVTNSVVHAHADSSQLVSISVARLKDRVRISVTDSGSETVPHLREPDDQAPGGAGLRIVDELCLSWGIVRDGAGATEVWCEVAFDGSGLSHFTSAPA